MAWKTSITAASPDIQTKTVSQQFRSQGGWPVFTQQRRRVTTTTKMWVGVNYANASSIVDSLISADTENTTISCSYSDPIGGGVTITQIVQTFGDWEDVE